MSNINQGDCCDNDPAFVPKESYYRDCWLLSMALLLMFTTLMTRTDYSGSFTLAMANYSIIAALLLFIHFRFGFLLFREGMRRYVKNYHKSRH